MTKEQIEDLELAATKAMLIELHEQNIKLIKFLKMAACYACCEGSIEEEEFTESLLMEFGVDDDK